MTEIDTLVFDVGKVLIDFDFTPVVDYLHRHGAPPLNREIFIERTQMTTYDRGGLTSREFLRGLSALTSEPVDPVELKRLWCSIFTPVEEMLSLAKNIKHSNRCRVFLLTNVSELHWEKWVNDFHLLDVCHDALPSFQAGCVKPDLPIFEQAEERFRLIPEKTLYFDDHPDNFAAACTRGWRGRIHRSPEGTISELIRLELVMPRAIVPCSQGCDLISRKEAGRSAELRP